MINSDTENRVKVSHLLELTRSQDRLKIFGADLCEDGSFDATVAGCHGVFHVASPVVLTPKDPENDLIKPTVEGTLNVLRACTKAKSVKHLVVTSSVAATALNELEEQNGVIVNESCWTDVGFQTARKKNPHWAYAISKTLAEQAALQYGKEQSIEVVSVIPSLLVGSSITPTVRESIQSALSLITGNQIWIQNLKGMQSGLGSISMVHIDDVCSAHIFLTEQKSVQGRYICCSINITLLQLANFLSKCYPHYNVPTQFEDAFTAPKVIFSS
eukprot:Gb_10731 [translate_table: standard]